MECRLTEISNQIENQHDSTETNLDISAQNPELPHDNLQQNISDKIDDLNKRLENITDEEIQKFNEHEDRESQEIRYLSDMANVKFGLTSPLKKPTDKVSRRKSTAAQTVSTPLSADLISDLSTLTESQLLEKLTMKNIFPLTSCIANGNLRDRNSLVPRQVISALKLPGIFPHLHLQSQKVLFSLRLPDQFDSAQLLSFMRMFSKLNTKNSTPLPKKT